MKSILDWYNDEETPQETEAEPIQVDAQELPIENQDPVLLKEYENCIKSIGICKLLSVKLESYVNYTQEHDFNSLSKEKVKGELRLIVNELSKAVSEL